MKTAVPMVFLSRASRTTSITRTTLSLPISMATKPWMSWQLVTQDSTVFWYKKNGPSWDRTTIADEVVSPQGIDVIDVDSDDQLDVILAASGENAVYWYRNDGAGQFTQGVVDDSLSAPMEAEAADFNGDGDIDIVVITADSSNAVALYTNDGNEVFEREFLFSGHFPVDVEVGDWTGNGAVDIIVGFNTRFVDPTQNIVLFENDGNGNFTDTPLWVEDQELVFALKLIDADRDDDLDLVFARENLRPALAMLPNESGVAGELVIIENDNPHDFLGIDGGDIDNDGDIDFVAAGSDSESIYLFSSTEFEPCCCGIGKVICALRITTKLSESLPIEYTNRSRASRTVARAAAGV